MHKEDARDNSNDSNSPHTPDGCQDVPALDFLTNSTKKRASRASALRADGVPVRVGY